MSQRIFLITLLTLSAAAWTTSYAKAEEPAPTRPAASKEVSLSGSWRTTSYVLNGKSVNVDGATASISEDEFVMHFPSWTAPLFADCPVFSGVNQISSPPGFTPVVPGSGN